jgi:UrcA family protein
MARLAALTLGAGAVSLLGTAAALANNSSESVQPTVTVRAPRVVEHSSTVGANGLAVEQLTLTRMVSFADLNLDTSQGKVALKLRIRDNAREACQELASRYPYLLWTDDVQTCVHNAMLTWMPQIHGVPATAQ